MNITQKQIDAIKKAKLYDYTVVGQSKLFNTSTVVISNGVNTFHIFPDGTDAQGLSIEKAIKGYWVDPVGGVHSPNETDPASMYENRASDYKNRFKNRGIDEEEILDIFEKYGHKIYAAIRVIRKKYPNLTNQDIDDLIGRYATTPFKNKKLREGKASITLDIDFKKTTRNSNTQKLRSMGIYGMGRSFGIEDIDYIELSNLIGADVDFSASGDLKVELSWHLYDDITNTVIEIWNYKNGPRYRGIANKTDDEYEDLLREITYFSVGTNNPIIAKAYFKSIGIKVID